MNFDHGLAGVCAIVALLVMVGCGIDIDDLDDLFPEEHICGDTAEMAKRSFDLSESEKAAWHKSNLYDAATDTYYLPPELFYATAWNGEKQLTEPEVDDFRGSIFCIRVKGPVTWTHPQTGDQYSIYREGDENFANYWHPSEQGFELVYSTINETFYAGAIHIPSGDLWRIKEPRTSTFSMWHAGVLTERTQTIEIEEILFDSQGVLAWMVFRRYVDGELIVEHLLEPKRGITRTYVFDQEAYDGGAEGYDCGDKSVMAAESYALSDPEKDAWSRANLYDSETNSYYLPPELWTGAVWDGDKTFVVHDADLYFGDTFCKRITGPTDWIHPLNNDVYQIYTRTKRDEEQFFVMNPHGVGRVYDSRRGGQYYEDEVKFPAGAGWKVGEFVSLPYRRWKDGAVEDRIRKIKITHIIFDENDVLAAMRYRYFAGDKGEVLDHDYMYMPRRGMVSLHNYSDF